MAGKRTPTGPRKRPMPPAAAVPVLVTLEEERLLVTVEEQLLRSGVEVEDRVALRRIALMQLRERDGGG